MINIAKSEKEIREELFLNTAAKTGLNPAIVEKDFWVCYVNQGHLCLSRGIVILAISYPKTMMK